jgi:hypothetical protein
VVLPQAAVVAALNARKKRRRRKRCVKVLPFALLY